MGQYHVLKKPEFMVSPETSKVLEDGSGPLYFVLTMFPLAQRRLIKEKFLF